MLNWGELEGRIDAGFYSPLNEKITYQFPTKQLRQITSSFSGGTPDKSNFEYWQGDIPWASSKDIKDFYLTDTEDHISEKAIEKSSAKIVPANSVLVVVRSGILIHTFPVSVNLREVAINQDLKALITDSSVLGKYLGYYFVVFNDYILKQTVKHSTTVQSVNTFEFERLQIPIPPIEIQQQIIDQLDKAYAEKKAKEAEAREKLASVDSLVLDALGIRLPEAEENTLAKRIFFTKSSDISSDRIDPHYFSPKFSGLKKILDSKQINFVKLRSASKKIFSGITPLSGGESYTTKELGIPFVRSGDYSILNEINFDDLIYLEPEIHFKLMKGSKLEKGDLLIAIVGATIGKVGVYKYSAEANINQAVCGVRLHKEFNPFFVQAFLLSSVGQMILDRIKRPVARANINLDEIGEMLVPQIDLDKQAEIVARVEAIYAEAKLLREEGAELLKNAKAEVEKMILGG